MTHLQRPCAIWPAPTTTTPNSMPVAKAREHIRSFLTPVTAIERLHVRNALGRILAEDIVSPITSRPRQRRDGRLRSPACDSRPTPT